MRSYLVLPPPKDITDRSSLITSPNTARLLRGTILWIITGDYGSHLPPSPNHCCCSSISQHIGRTRLVSCHAQFNARSSCSGDLVHGCDRLLLRLARSGTSSLHIAARHGNIPSAMTFLLTPDLGGLMYLTGSSFPSLTSRVLAGATDSRVATGHFLLSLELKLAPTGCSPEDKSW